MTVTSAPQDFCCDICNIITFAGEECFLDIDYAMCILCFAAAEANGWYV